MSFTVKIIFVGLIGFVPSPKGGEDVAALLVDPAGIPGTCVPPHISAVFLLDGQCESESECRDANEPEHDKRLGLRGGLFWELKQESIDFSDDAGGIEFQMPNWIVRVFEGGMPGGSGQSYFSWVPDMEKLTSGKGQLEPQCINPDPECKLSAQFKFQGGRMSACHMFHDPGSPVDEKVRVRFFNYATSKGAHFSRAVADVEQIIFQGEGETVDMQSYHLSDGKPYRKAVLRPELLPSGERVVTLIVVNVPNLCHSRMHSHEPYSQAHSDLFFHFLRDDPGPRSVRILSEKTSLVDPGPCEKELVRLEEELIPQECGKKGDRFKRLKSRLFSIKEAIHAATACDGTRFPKPTQ